MDIQTELLELRRRLRYLQLGFAGVTLGASALMACGAYRAGSPSTPPPSEAAIETGELTIERLNVREPDGTLRMVISNKARAPDPVADGKPVPGRKGGNEAGLIFYDENGNESGGLIYGGKEREGSGSWFAFDRHDQDQTLAIGYNEGPGGKYESGMYVWDRPDATLGELLPKYRELAALPQGDERNTLVEQMREAGEFERMRAFVGRDEEGTAMVSLLDPQARLRLKMWVGPDGEPRIEFLAPDGTVTYALTSDGPHHE